GDHPGKDSHQRAFAGPVLADDRMQLSRLNVEGDIVERHDARKALRDVLNRNQRFGRGHNPASDLRRPSRKRTRRIKIKATPPATRPSFLGFMAINWPKMAASTPVNKVRLMIVTKPKGPPKIRWPRRPASRNWLKATATTTTAPTIRPS